MRKRDKYLIVSMLAVLLGFGVNAWLASGDHSMPDVANAGWFGFWTVEIYRISKITIEEKKKESSYEG